MMGNRKNTSVTFTFLLLATQAMPIVPNRTEFTNWTLRSTSPRTDPLSTVTPTNISRTTTRNASLSTVTPTNISRTTTRNASLSIVTPTNMSRTTTMNASLSTVTFTNTHSSTPSTFTSALLSTVTPTNISRTTPPLFTTVPLPTATHTHNPPTPPPTNDSKVDPTVNKYIVREGDTVCIVLEAAIILHITYPLKRGGNNVVDIIIPGDPSVFVSGDCQGRFQTLNISFFDDFSIFFTFSKDINQHKALSKSGDAFSYSHPGYQLSTLGATFNASEARFPGMAWEYGHSSSGTTSKSNFPSVRSDLDYFKCDKPLLFNLYPDDNITIDVRHLRFKAFNTGRDSDFNGQSAVCPTKITTVGLQTWLIIGLGASVAVIVAGLIVGNSIWHFWEGRKLCYSRVSRDDMPHKDIYSHLSKARDFDRKYT